MLRVERETLDSDESAFGYFAAAAAACWSASGAALTADSLTASNDERARDWLATLGAFEAGGVVGPRSCGDILARQRQIAAAAAVGRRHV